MATESTTSAASPSRRSVVGRKLRRAWRKERRFHHFRGLCHIILWLTALVLVDLLIDWLLLVPGYGRVTLLAVNAAALLTVAYLKWWRRLRRYDPVRVALQVENRHPNLRSVLVSYVQLDADAPRDDEISPVLIRALKREAVRQTEPVDFREIISYAELRRIAVFCLVVVTFFAAISIEWADFFRTLAYRMIYPSASLVYPTRVKIVRMIGPDTIRQGDPFELQIVCSGMVPQEGRLEYTLQGGRTETVSIRQKGDGRFSFSRPKVYEAFSYRVAVDDAESETRQVRVIGPPQIRDARIHVSYPDYLGMSAEDVTELNVEVPEGSQLTWRVRCDRRLAWTKMLRDQADPNTLAPDPDGMGGRISLTAGESFYYRFEWKDGEHGYEYADNVQYFVQVIPDAPPEVRLLEPAEDLKATVRKKLPLRFEAGDDHGLARADIVYRVNEGDEQRAPLEIAAKPAGETSTGWVLAESIAGLEIGDAITYAVEVADGRPAPAGPNVSRSRALHVSIVSEEDYVRYIQEKKAQLMREIKLLQEEETTASQQVREIGDETKPEGPEDGNTVRPDTEGP